MFTAGDIRVSDMKASVWNGTGWIAVPAEVIVTQTKPLTLDVKLLTDPPVPLSGRIYVREP